MEKLPTDLTGLHLFRRRLIPEECVPLVNDSLLDHRDGVLVTSWKTIRPKKEMDHGFSCYYLDKGYKISRFYRPTIRSTVITAISFPRNMKRAPIL